MAAPVQALQAGRNPGDFLGHVLHTDIRVYINGVPIAAYNIAGHTYVIASDLRAYGLSVIWDGDARTTTITRGPSTTAARPVVTAHAPVGSIAFPFVYTDIVAYVDGQRVVSHNVQGNMVVRLSDVVSAFGNSIWDAERREVHATTDGTMPRRPARPFFENYSYFQRDGQAQLATVNMLGNPFPNALRTNRSPGPPFSLPSTWWGDYNINRAYTTLTATIGRIDGSRSGTSTISFIGDGVTLAAFNVNEDTHPFDVSIDISNVLILRIQIDQPPTTAWIALANVMIQ